MAVHGSRLNAYVTADVLGWARISVSLGHDALACNHSYSRQRVLCIVFWDHMFQLPSFYEPTFKDPRRPLYGILGVSVWHV